MGGKKSKKETPNGGQSKSDKTATGKKEKVYNVQPGKPVKVLKGAQKWNTSHLLVIILPVILRARPLTLYCPISMKSVVSKTRRLPKSEKGSLLAKFQIHMRSKADSNLRTKEFT